MNVAGVNSKYRPEIDGLRAFAVTAVIINHFNRALLPGGYLGVDIFFVISGYVITSSLSGRSSHNFSDFLTSFYDRRIRRLVPALLVFVVITSLLLCLFNPDPGVSLGVGWRALFGISNISLFKSSTDYFGEASELNPFTHTWSLGVEEQFYLLFPLLIWFTGFGKQTKNGARNLFLWIGALALASSASFIWLYELNQPAAYFLMPFRFWEMAAGCLVFLVMQSRADIKAWIQPLPPLLLLGGMAGLMVYPMANGALTTLTIVTMAALLIAGLKPGTSTYTAFTNQKVVRIGLISYSVYLWHWSILSISRWTIGIHWWSVPFQLLLIIVIANASYQWVECPVRRKPSKRRGFVIASGAMVMVIGSLTTMAIGRAGLYSGDHGLKAEANVAAQQHSKESAIGCNLFDSPEQALAISGVCRSAQLMGRPTLYSLGDSHMSQFRKAIGGLAKRNQLNQAMVTGNGCLFPAAVIRGESRDCYERQLEIEQTLKRTVRSGDVVFIGNALYTRFNPDWGREGNRYRDADGDSIDIQTAARIYSEKVQELSRELNQRGVKVVFYVDSVQFPDLDRLPGTLCRTEWFRPAGLVSKACTQSLQAHLQQMDREFAWRGAWHNGIDRFTWNAYQYRRDCDGDLCRANSYHDSNHFNEDYASAVFSGFITDNPNLLSHGSIKTGE